MSKPHITISNDDDTKFVPTPTAWGELYGQWRKPLVRSLSKYGSPDEIEEAVHEAFLKVAGLSANLRLEKELEPKTVAEWRSFLCWQARGVLSNMRGKAAKFESLPDNFAEGFAEKLSCMPDVGRIDAELLRRAVCAAVWDACRTWKSPKAKYRALVMYLLDEYTADEVVRAVPEARTANNLHQMCHRVRLALAEAVRRPGSVLAELLCA